MSKRKSAINVPLGLGDRIKTAREAKGWTQVELGRHVGVSKSAVSQWEKGAVQNLKLGNLFAAAHVLEKDVRELVFGETAVRSVAEPRPVKYSAIPSQQLALLHHYENLPKNVRHHLRSLITALATSIAVNS